MSGSFHSFYVSSGMRANAFLPWGFGDPAQRAKRVELASARPLSAAVLETLRAQNAPFRATAERQRHLQAAGQAGTVFAITGQQVGLFLGPLYTIYKAATVIAVARKLSAESKRTCIPMFWLQTEDHDYAEIAHCELAVDLQPPVRIQLPDRGEGSRCSVSGLKVPAAIGPQLEKLAEVLEDRPFGREVLDLLRDSYRPEVPLSEAFAGLLAELFAEEGLLVFNPRQDVTGPLAAPIFRKALDEAPRLGAALKERGKALAASGFSEQVPLRPDTSLVFFHERDARGDRYRLSRAGDRWALAGAEMQVTDAEVRNALEREPLRFSTSALLRPLLQDTLFPTAAYVGGPAEVDYFAQMTALYPLFGLEAPLLVHRSRFLLVPQRIRLLMKRLQLETADFAAPLDQVKRRVASRMVTHDGSRPGAEWSGEIDRRLSAFVKGPDVDPGLVRAADRTRESVHRALDRLGRRYERATLERETTISSRVNRIAGWLQPQGHPQERVYNFATFAAKLGLRAFREKLLDAVDPLNPALKEIDL